MAGICTVRTALAINTLSPSESILKTQGFFLVFFFFSSVRTVERFQVIRTLSTEPTIIVHAGLLKYIFLVPATAPRLV